MTAKKNKGPYTVGRIKSLEDLKLEKAKLEMEILRTEDQIKGNYREILDALTFRNLFHTITNDFTTTSNVITKVFDVGKSIFRGKKKKRKKDDHQASGASRPEMPGDERPSDEITGE
jgi:hypothetical protein